VEKHIELLEVYVTSPSEITAQRLINRKGYRRTLQEKVELTIALEVHRRKVDGPGFQKSKSLERLARLLDQLGQACIDCVDIEGLKQVSDKRFMDYAKLLRRMRKSLALVVINPEQANTRQGLKLGRRAKKITHSLKDVTARGKPSAPEDYELAGILHFQINRMIHLLTEVADALLAANFGPAVRLQNYKQLKNAAHAFTSNSGHFGVERLALTRSGSTVAALRTEHESTGEVMAVYKEGQAHKVLEEVSGVDEWRRIFPKVAPNVISHHVGHENEPASLVIEHLPGRTLESMLLNNQWDSANRLLGRLTKTLRKIWKASWTRERPEPGYMEQLRTRMPETHRTHPALFSPGQIVCGFSRPDFSELINQVERMEPHVRAPFSVLIHGDFNVDNLLYDDLKDRIYLIDLHRASYSDYVQDLSVLMVSIYRLPIMGFSARKEIMQLIRYLYQFAKRFANSSKDHSFDTRLAIALSRSLATSTRFIYDTRFAARLAHRAGYLLESVARLPIEATEKYNLPLEDIFSE
jgi:aminoglycoside phosphotransferase (APT) family kinase protein